MKKYYLAKYGYVGIEEVDVISETASFVTLANGNRREAKVTNYGTYHQTREAAKADILERLMGKKNGLFLQIAAIEREIEKANQL